MRLKRDCSLLLQALLVEIYIGLTWGFLSPPATLINKKLCVLYSSGSGSNSSVERPSKKKRNLYEVLQCRPDATRDELKRSYIALAKNLHPDAKLEGASKPSDSFSEVASAWKTLSNAKDRKKYDRNLRAEAFTENVDKALNENAGPAIKSIFDNMAVPLIRRTTATTAAVFTAASNRSDGENSDFSTVLESVMNAGKEAGKAVEYMELVEKYKQLEESASKDRDEIKQIDETMKKLRVEKKETSEKLRDETFRVSLNTPESIITAEDSFEFLNRKNLTDEDFGIMKNILGKHTAKHDVEVLSKAEADYQTKMRDKEEVETEFLKIKRNLRKSEERVQKAIEEREAARLALRNAIRTINESRLEHSETAKQLRSFEKIYKKSVQDSSKSASTLNKQREIVRKLLFRKEQEKLPTRKKTAEPMESNTLGQQTYSTSLEKLQQKETFLLNRSRELKSRAFNLESKYAVLKKRIQNMDVEARKKSDSSQILITDQVVSNSKNSTVEKNATLIDEPQFVESEDDS